METYNQRLEGKVQGAKNYTPLLPGLEFETIRKALNEAMGIDMVQHGAEAQFAWHGDEPITVILPDGPQLQFQVLGNAEAVQRWYIERNREVIAKKGKDYIGDKTRWFWFGNHGNLFSGREWTGPADDGCDRRERRPRPAAGPARHAARRPAG